MVRELSKAPVCFLFDCCAFYCEVCIESVYSSEKTRIRLVLLYQIHESFCSITRCVSLCLVYCLLLFRRIFGVWSSKFAHRGHLVAPFLSPNPNPHLNRIFLFFNHVFPSHFCMQYCCTNPFDLQERASPI